jgi:hypothetical protein
LAVDEPGIYGGQRHVTKAGVCKRGEVAGEVAEAWAGWINVAGGEAAAGRDGPVFGAWAHAVASITLSDTLGTVGDGYVDPVMRQCQRPCSRGRASLHAVLRGCPDGRLRSELEFAAKAGSDLSMLRRWAYATARMHGVDTLTYADAVVSHMKEVR